MLTNSKRRGVITRLDLIVILLITGTIGGLMVYSSAEASEVIVSPVPPPVAVQPVEKESSVDKLWGWLRSQVKEEEPSDIIVKMHGQRISSETADELKQVFDAESVKRAEELAKKAAFDAKQVDCLVRNMVFEASGEPQIGQRWVYDVVRNRTLSNYRGNETMCETIFDPKQFSWANTDPDKVPEFRADLLMAQELVSSLYFDPNHRDITCGATHYLTTEVMWQVDWSREALQGNSSEGLVLLAIIGKHAFFGKEGCPSYEE